MPAWSLADHRDHRDGWPGDARGSNDGAGHRLAAVGGVALRLAFSTINDALGAQPDAQLAQSVPSTFLGWVVSSAAAENGQEPGLGGGVWRDRQFRGERAGGPEEF